MVAGLLEQEVVLGPLAADRKRWLPRRKFNLGAVDEPRAGRVHALKAREIENHAFRAFGE